jgi:hypothetical protein
MIAIATIIENNGFEFGKENSLEKEILILLF